ncbi:hypothetical protein [Arthrobacter sp. B10-11]|uniref:hypothetical protein n=1 Tax=Arthrobacter sp. B10-11 TaxID=3081160 RepID=UPI0029538C96|nr:hypothetical protein [Arthrobacter sp. B10-11]MDV8148540.1 hypothetical protein [Arthrobacter sp. B10-11]
MTTPTITVWESGPSKPEVHAVWNPLLGSYDIAIILDGGYGSEDDACKMANFWLRDLQEEGVPVADAVGPASAPPQDYKPTVFTKQFAKHELQWLVEQYMAKAKEAHQTSRVWMNRALEAESRLAIYEPGDEPATDITETEK